MQLEAAKRLNDSLILQIQGLQEITAQQLEVSSRQSEIIKKQLNILEVGLDEQIYEKRPKLLIEPPIIKDSIFSKDGLYYTPYIEIPIKNIGSRYAKGLTYRGYMVYNQYNNVNIRNQLLIELESNGWVIFKYKPTILAEFRNDFYYCHEVTYFDIGLNRSFNDVQYFHYCKEGGVFKFLICNIEKEAKIKTRINKELKYLNAPLFDQ